VSDSVLDASAVLALLEREPGGEFVRSVLDEGIAFISTVNITEVLTKLMQHGLSADEADDDLESLHLERIPFALSTAARAAALSATTKRFGLSLGDRACLALAIELGHRTITTDRIWEQLELGVPVVLAR